MQTLKSRQKIQIKNLAAMVDSTRDMTANIRQLASEYETELLAILESLKSLDKPPLLEGTLETQTTKQSKKPKRKTGTRPLTRKQQEELKRYEEMVDASSKSSNIPKWAKSLYRNFMKKYHPDKSNKIEISIDVIREVNSSYESERYDNLLQICAVHDVYTNQLGFSKQKNMLNDMNIKMVKNVEDLQKTLAWKWGSQISEDENSTIELIKILCRSNGFEPPQKSEIIKVLKQFDIF